MATYTVQRGDSLSAIAARYGMNWRDLYNQNKSLIGSNPNLIRSGLKLNIGGTAPTAVKPTAAKTTATAKPNPVQQKINEVANTLTPLKPFSEVMPYDTYAAPQRAVFDEWQKNSLRPEFERFTLNPYKANLANQIAASGSFRMGGAQQNTQDQLRLAEQPFYNQVEQARNSYEDMIRQGYNERLQRYMESPTSFNNIGEPTAPNPAVIPMPSVNNIYRPAI